MPDRASAALASPYFLASSANFCGNHAFIASVQSVAHGEQLRLRVSRSSSDHGPKPQLWCSWREKHTAAHLGINRVIGRQRLPVERESARCLPDVISRRRGDAERHTELSRIDTASGEKTLAS